LWADRGADFAVMMPRMKTAMIMVVGVAALCLSTGRFSFGEEPKKADAPTTAAAPAADANVLTDDEKKAGWKLLFDGKAFDGWHSFKRDNVRPGWQVKDGALVCV